MINKKNLALELTGVQLIEMTVKNLSCLLMTLHRNDRKNLLLQSLSGLVISDHRNDRKNVLKSRSKFDLTGNVAVGMCIAASVHKRRNFCNILFSTFGRACNA